MKISEVFDRSAEWGKIDQEPEIDGDFNFQFTSKGKKYLVVFSRFDELFHSGDFEHFRRHFPKDMPIFLEKLYSVELKLDLGRQNYPKYGFDLTGFQDQYAVLSTVLAIIKQFLEDKKVQGVVFQSWSARNEAIYKKIFDKVNLENCQKFVIRNEIPYFFIVKI